jgi:protein TonB
MFENFTAAKRKKLPRWLLALLLFSIGVHALVIGAMVLHGWWKVDKLGLPKEGVTIAVVSPPPPPPAARKGVEKPSDSSARPDRVRRPVDETTQPVRLLSDEPVTLGGAGDQLGRPDGVVDGTEDGTDGPCVGPGCSTIGIPESSGEPPCVGPSCDECTGDDCDDTIDAVPDVVIEQRRIGGERRIYPPDTTKAAIVRDRLRRVVVTVKMCLSKGGTVQHLEVLRSSGYPEYDALIRSTMRTWKYSPFEVNGNAVPVCTSVTFIYNQR